MGNEEDIFAQQCGAGLPSRELNTLIEDFATAFCLVSSEHEYAEHWRHTISKLSGKTHFPDIYPFHPV